MKLLSQTLSVLLMALFLQGCQLGQDDEEDDGTIVTEFITTDGTDETIGGSISNSETYELVVIAGKNYLTLEGDLSSISIQGHNNTFIIDSDTAIGSISITGDGNTISVKEGVNLTLTNLTVKGNSNDVLVFDVVNTPTILPAEGEPDNLICENNTSVAVCF
jgi:hypothetical protein